MGELHASGAAAVDELVDELSALVETHKLSPLQLRELHSSLQAVTARAASALNPEEAAENPAELTIVALKARLKSRGLPISGRKADLVERLAAATELTKPGSATVATAGRNLILEPRGVSEAMVHAGMAQVEADPTDPALRSQFEKIARTHGGQGPQTGIFTDGSCVPNPGPGGWGVVAVCDGQVLWSARLHEPERTTNNRMELGAIIHALWKVGDDGSHTIYSDSQLCVKTLNEWVYIWADNGWKKKDGQVPMNIDLVQEAYALAQRRPNVCFKWIKAHAGWQWNEYADRLANSWMADSHFHL